MNLADHFQTIIRGRGFPRSLYHWHELSGLSHSTFYSIVYGRRVPSVTNAYAVAAAAGLTIEHVFEPLFAESRAGVLAGAN